MSYPSPLSIIVNPPGLQAGMPGDLLELYVVVTNQGKYGALIDVYIDEFAQTPRQWCNSPVQRIALDPGHSGEVSFQFQIPFDAPPGTYNYTLIIDAPEHYAEDTPIKYDDCQLKVLLKEQTVVGISDPTFSLQPATNPSYPIVLKANEPLSISVTVNNRSAQVDRFRLTCLDLAPDWYTIRYSTTDLEGPGLVAEPNKLNLNPAMQGTILFQLHPPADTLAGNYSPTIRLHSANAPDLVLLDLIYIHIPATYQLVVEFITILGKVSRSSGKYEIRIANQGNVIRELAVGAKGRDEENLCSYRCDPSQVRILPGKTKLVNLSVTPTHWWRRSLLGRGLDLNFQLEIQDLQDLPLPDKLPQGTLLWQSRPWWQLLLLVLAVLGLVGSISFIVWQIFRPKPLEIVSFNSDNLQYTESDDQVLLSWEIHHPQQLQKLALRTQAPTPGAIIYQYDREQRQLKELNNQQLPACEFQPEESILSCSKINIGGQKPGKYTLVLEASDRQGKLSSKPIEFVVNAKPAPEAINLKVEKPDYITGEPIVLSWQIKNYEQLSNLKVITTQNGTRVTVPSVFTLDQLKSSKLCGKPNKQILPCQISIRNTSKSGKYAFEFQLASNSSAPPPTPEKIEVEVLSKPGKIVFFKLKERQAPDNISIPIGTPLDLNWQVEGEEVTVRLNGSTVNTKGLKTLAAFTQPGQRQIRLEVFNKSGQLVDSASFDVESVTPTNSSGDDSKPVFQL